MNSSLAGGLSVVISRMTAMVTGLHSPSFPVKTRCMIDKREELRYRIFVAARCINLDFQISVAP